MTPSFLVKPIVIPLICSLVYFYDKILFNAYFTWAYGEMGMLSFPLDSEISRLIYDLFGKK